MLGTNFSLLFYLKRPKNYVPGPMPVYLRITVDEDVKELCTARYCDPNAWHKEGEKATGKTEAAKELNSHLSLLKLKAFEARSVLISENKTITAQAIKNRLTGKPEKVKGILEVFRRHNEQMAALVGRQFPPGTLERYQTALAHARSFIQWKYGLEELELTRLDFEFVSQFAF